MNRRSQSYVPGDVPDQRQPGRKAGIDDKVAADQRGHGIGVSLDVYASSGLAQ